MVRLYFVALSFLAIIVGLTSRDAVADAPPSEAISEASSGANDLADPEVVSLWGERVPTWGGVEGEERDVSGPQSNMVASRPVIRLTDVSRPELHVYRASEDPRTPFVVICPGGGFSILAWDLEGTEIAVWLRSIGVNAGVLKYRVPTSREAIKHLAPVQDAHRAMQLVRERYAPQGAPVGLLGFSAGGYTVIRTAAANHLLADSGDAKPTAAPRADFCVLVYPAYLINKKTSQFTQDFTVSPDFPPTFFAHAANDPHRSAGSAALHQQLLDLGVSSELHVFSTGGHGFGGRISGSPTDAWRSLCESWMRSQGILNATSTSSTASADL